MATTINLAPGTQHIVALRARRQRLFMAAALIALAAVVIWGGLYVYQRQLLSSEKEITARVQSVQAEIANLDSDAQRIILFEERLRDLGALLDGHISWNPILADIERLLPPTTTITSMQMDIDSNSIALIGSTPDMDQVALTLASLGNSPGHKTAFTEATINGVSRQEEGSTVEGTLTPLKYNFDAKLTFDPAILYVNK
jgi:Tfp pilus assembly protein PilN